MTLIRSDDDIRSLNSPMALAALRSAALSNASTEDIESNTQSDPHPDSPEYATKYAAYIRQKEVWGELCGKLYNHKVPAFWWNARDGKEERIAELPWLAGKYRFNFGDGTVRRGRSPARPMIVRETDVKAALTADHPTGERDEPGPRTDAEIDVANGDARETEPDTLDEAGEGIDRPIRQPNSDAEGPAPAKRRGAKPKYAWDEFWREVVRVANTPDGLPQKQADLESHMLRWCQRSWDDEPGLSTIREKLNKLEPYLDA